MPEAPSKPEILHEAALGTESGTTTIRDAIIRACRRRDWTVAASRAHASPRIETSRDAINEHLQSYPSRRLVQYYQVNPADARRVILVPGQENWRPTAYIQERLMSMIPARFERLLGNVLVAEEFDEIAVTPPSQDGGFDFIYRLDLDPANRPNPGAFSGPTMLANTSLYGFGQAKRYALSHPIEVAQVNELVGSIQTLVQGGGTPTYATLRQRLESWGWQQNLPILPLFATSGRYRGTLPALARKQGWCLFDGEQLAQRIIHTEGPFATRADADQAIDTLGAAARAGVTLL